MKLSRDIQSLSVFKRDSSKILRQIKKTKQPVILTVNGKAAAVVHDPDSYEDYLRERERHEAIEGIRRGLADVKAGRTKGAEDVFSDLFKKFGIEETE
jgi:prevent-host-death family protein